MSQSARYISLLIASLIRMYIASTFGWGGGSSNELIIVSCATFAGQNSHDLNLNTAYFLLIPTLESDFAANSFKFELPYPR